MYIYIWDCIDKLTNHWHSHGGAVAFAESLEEVRQLARANKHNQKDTTIPEDSEIFTQEPTECYPLDDCIYGYSLDLEPYLLIFPNAGCC